MRNMRFLSFFSFAVLFAVTACTQPSMKAVSVQDAEALMLAKGDQLQIVDLRTDGEVKSTGIIPGAVVIDFYAADFNRQIKQLDKKRPVLLYCAAGSRSAQAASRMVKSDFCEVYEMSPGMRGWMAAGKTTVKK